jgi:hypothetical protein
MRKDKSLRQQNGTPSTAGFILIGVGAFILLSQIMPSFFGWVKGFSQDAYFALRKVLSWQSILIIVGIFIGYRRKFGHPFGWITPIIIGVLFMIVGHSGWNYILPIVLINVGIVILLNSYFAPKAIGKENVLNPTFVEPSSPSSMEQTNDYPNQYSNTSSETEGTTNPSLATSEYTSLNAANNPNNTGHNPSNNFSATENSVPQFLETVSILSGSQRIVNGKLSGGDLVAILGGNDINLTNAQIDGSITLDVTQIMGATTLIIPPHWQIVNQITMIMGGIEDKRPPLSGNQTEVKTIFLKGITIMGGVEIRSF